MQSCLIFFERLDIRKWSNADFFRNQNLIYIFIQYLLIYTFVLGPELISLTLKLFHDMHNFLYNELTIIMSNN